MKLRVPVDHPHAAQMLALFDFLATGITVDGFTATRPGNPDGPLVFLKALRAAGYTDQVDAALHEVEREQIAAKHKADTDRAVMDKIMSHMDRAGAPMRLLEGVMGTLIKGTIKL